MQEVVKWSAVNGVAVVKIDNPPVNAANRAVRTGLHKCFSEINARPDIAAVVVACEGRTFVAGADISEFDTGIAPPGFHEVFRLIEDFSRPVVAAVHGTALGGGAELALACHYRVLEQNAQIGLPEITLGIIPGAGGTQRLPRLVPLGEALDMMLSGRPITAAKAKAIGLADAVAAGDLMAQAIAFARDLVARGAGPRRTRELPVKDTDKAKEILAEKRAQVAKTMRNRASPLVLIDVVQAAVELPFEHGLRIEGEKSTALMQATEGRALRHLFFAERNVRKIPGLPSELKPRPVARVGIVGAGTMGGGIAMCFANAGVPVTIVEANEANLERGLATIRKNYERSVARGRLRPQEVEQRMVLIAPTLDYRALASADLLIEAVFENMALKKDIFRKLDAIARPGAILATNTSTLDIDEIAAVTKRPQDVLATALALARQIKKVGVVAKVAYGFIGNRMMDPYAREAERCVLEGATPEQVDSALEDFGMAMGILAVFDLSGVDVGHLTRVERKHLLPDDPAFYRCSAMLYERGWLGQKTGRGFYRYDNAERRRTPDPEVTEMFWAEGARLGVPRRTPSSQEIQERCFYALINEGARVLEEGVALRAADIDVVYTSGYGFPRWRGGPMFYADTIGLKTVCDGIARFARTLDPRYWQTAPLLAKLAAEGSSFAQWDAARGA